MIEAEGDTVADDMGAKKTGSDAPTKKPPGRTLTEEERAESGRGKMFWRPRVAAIHALREIADRWGISRSDALERLVYEEQARALKSK